MPGQLSGSSGINKDYINPIVVLVTVGKRLEWNLLEDGDLYHKAKDIRLTLLEHYRGYQQDPDIRTQHPEIDNAATYALYAYYDADGEKISNWCLGYYYLTGQDPTTSPLE